MTTTTAIEPSRLSPRPVSLIEKIAARYSVEPTKMLATLKATAFKVVQQGRPVEVTNEQMMALLVVADQYRLNPFTREIYAFLDSKSGGIVPIVGVDGWSRIINEHPQFDGMSFHTDFDGPKPVSVECTMHRKDREHPTKITEYYRECKRDTSPWSSHPARMLRHKAMIQCARLAFGFVGIYDEDEGARIIEGEIARPTGAVADLNAEISAPEKAGSTPVGLPTSGDDGSGVQLPGTGSGEPKGTAGPAVKAPAESGAGASDDMMPPPTLAEVLTAIAMAADQESLALTLDLARSLTVGDPQAAAEIDVAARAQRKKFPA